MAVLTPTQLKALCEEYHLSPSKQYGQHYLISDAPIQKMIKAGELKKTDTVVEIGPGFGILTLALAPLVKKVMAFEIEKKLESYWQEKTVEFPNVEIIWGNFLRQIELMAQLPKQYKVIANVPYQITSDLIRTLLEAEVKPDKMIIMLQKEVAERICAKPPSASSGQARSHASGQAEAMSLLAVSVQYYGTPRIVGQVSRGNFWPVPGVDSAVLAIDIHSPEPEPTKITDEQFFRIVKAGFAHKRKQLWNNIANGLHLDADVVKDVLRQTTGNERVRAEELTIAQWRMIVAQLSTPS